jgi:hypothetical protein
MSSLDLIKFAANENHVKFRSALNEMLYAKLSYVIKESTIDMISEVFNVERLQESSDLVDYINNVISEAEERLGTEFTEQEISESVSYIISLLEKKKEEDEDEEDEDKKKSKKKKSHKKKSKKKDDEDEDEDEEDEDEKDEEEEEEEEEEDKVKKKNGKIFHFDINSHNKEKDK